MKNYKVTLFYKTQLNAQERIFECVVRGKKNYIEKAKNILSEYRKGSGFSFFVSDYFCGGVTDLKEGTIIIVD